MLYTLTVRDLKRATLTVTRDIRYMAISEDTHTRQKENALPTELPAVLLHLHLFLLLLLMMMMMMMMMMMIVIDTLAAVW